jgi:hypothetical protein
MTLLKVLHRLSYCLLLVALAACQGANPQPLVSSAQLPSPQVPLIASYTPSVTLDPAAKTLLGRETITYTNTTSSPIPDLVFHLYLNAFKDENTLYNTEGGSAHRGFGLDPRYPGHIDVTALCVKDGPALSLTSLEDGTLARAALPAPVAPGQAIQLDVEFNALLPKVYARTGFAGQDFFMVGQWFPKLGVWQNGAWNAYAFHANAEFYADFGAYDVTITVPANYVTGGSGQMVSATPNVDGTQTVRYHAEPVIDFAWTASPHFRTATRAVGGAVDGGGAALLRPHVEITYLYLPEHAWTVQRVLDAAEKAVGYFSAWYGDYPYARLTLVDVPGDGQGAGGMEYPTLVTVGTLDVTGTGLSLGAGDHTLETVAVHEVAHQWFQSLVATNEAEEAWLDEGFADFSAAKVLDQVYGADRSAYDVPALGLRVGYADMRRLEFLMLGHTPMYGRAWDFDPTTYGVASYSKPVMALRTLENVLGERTFLRLMHTYATRYTFKHPTTADFRAVVTEVSGEDQAWFFDGLVYNSDMVNYMVTAMDEHSVTVTRLGALHLPTAVRVEFADGTVMTEPWDGADSPHTFSYPQAAPVVSAQIDPRHCLTAETDALDNGLTRAPDLNAWLAVAVRLIYNVQNALLALGGL